MWGIVKGLKFADIAKQNSWETAGVVCLVAVAAGINKQVLPESSLVYGLGITFIGFLLGFFVRLRSYRLISGTATSKIASAAQGFTEISGRVVKTGTELRTPYSNIQCAWYRRVIEEKRIDPKTKHISWRFVSEESSSLPICVSDGSGENVFVMPTEMQRLHMPRTVRIEDDSFAFGIGDYRHTEYFLKEGDPVLINGAFATFGLNGLRAARHLLSNSSNLEHIKEIQKTIRYQISNQIGLNDKETLDREHIHVISPCPLKKSGVLAYGREKDILAKKVWMIGLCGALTASLLVITVLTQEHFTEQELNQYEKSHSVDTAAFSEQNDLAINAQR